MYDGAFKEHMLFLSQDDARTILQFFYSRGKKEQNSNKKSSASGVEIADLLLNLRENYSLESLFLFRKTESQSSNRELLRAHVEFRIAQTILKNIPNTATETNTSEVDLIPNHWKLSHLKPQEDSSDFYKLLYGVVLMYFSKEGDSAIVIRHLARLPGYPRYLVQMLDTDIFWTSRDMKQSLNSLATIAAAQDRDTLLLAMHYIDVLVATRKIKAISGNSQISLIALALSNQIWNDRVKGLTYRDGEDIIKLALLSPTPASRADAFNLLGLFLIERHELQLAYDVYQTWFSKKLENDTGLQLGLTNDISAINVLLQDLQMHPAPNEDTATLYANLAYVCSTMYDLLENSLTKQKLYLLAEHFISLATELNPDDLAARNSRGTIYFDQRKLLPAIEDYRYCYQNAKTDSDRLVHLRNIIDISITLLAEEGSNSTVSCHEIASLMEDLVRISNQLGVSSSQDAVESQHRIGRLYSIQKNVRKYNLSLNRQKQLWMVYYWAKKLEDSLRYDQFVYYQFDLHEDRFDLSLYTRLKECVYSAKQSIKKKSEPIAFYTQWSTLSYLFNVSGNQDAIPKPQPNHLSVMNVNYMNDPEEGLIFLQQLKKYFPKKQSPEGYRQRFSDENLVFLKSFTTQVDTLNMWSMYGSSRESGGDCDGCCVVIAPETFDFALNRYASSEGSQQLISNQKDDLYLYSVVYVEKNNPGISALTFPGSPREQREAKKKYTTLICSIKEFCNGTGNNPEVVFSCLMPLLDKLIFLFKDASYKLEKEKRLLFTRRIDTLPRDFNAGDIHLTPQNPPKLYLNPDFQVFVEQIIAGPKTTAIDTLVPYWQLLLEQMRKEWPYQLTRRELRPKVRPSEIHIR